MKYGLIGEKLSHSFSKEIHACFAGYDYDITELKKDEIDLFFKRKDFLGINVTIPYKETVMKYLDTVSDTAKLCGSVNTIINDNGILKGYNTDFVGMKSLIKKAKIEIKGKNILILGTGGTSKTANAVAASLGAAKITFVSRTKKENAVTRDYAEKNLSDTDVIINTTPVGMFPDNCDCPICIDRFPRLSGVVDAVYNPISTKLVLQAREKGIKAAGGLYMLTEQARASSEIFTNKKIPHDVACSVYMKIKNDKQNIVLIGMPGSGKTTIGKKVSKVLSRQFIDTDKEIEKQEGMKITEIFKSKGEDYFRKIESDFISACSTKSGVVIATGGGVVLNCENILRLRQNGVIFLINRPLDKLTFSKSRPLSSTNEEKEALYAQRKEKYLRSADHIINTKNCIPKAVRDIIEESAK